MRRCVSCCGFGLLGAIALTVLLALPPDSARASEQWIAIAWDDDSAGRSYVGALDPSAPGTLAAAPVEVPGDGVLRARFGQLIHVSRATGIVTHLVPATIE